MTSALIGTAPGSAMTRRILLSCYYLFFKGLVAALRATRSMRCAHQACSLGPSGDDRERSENERDFLRSHSSPLRSLRVRSLWADPLALLPLSLPCERRPRLRFDWRRCADGATALSLLCLPPHRPPASRRARVPLPVPRSGRGRLIASVHLMVRERQGLCPLVPKAE